MSSEDTIRARFEADRRVLLDLSLRNTLISHRELKSRGLRIVDELSAQLFRILVSEGRAMSFLPAPTSEGTQDEINEDLLLFEQPPDDNDVPDRHSDNKLQTPYSEMILQRRLLNTFYAARTHLEERGVNVLYKRVTLGKYGELTLDRARALAASLRLEARAGGDPAEHVWRLEDPERYDLRTSYPEPAGLEGESMSTVRPLAVAFR